MKSFEEILKEMHLVIEDGKTVEAHTYLVVQAMDRYLAQFKSTTELYCLHTGDFESHHLTAVFTEEDLAKKYIEKFTIKDSPEIKKYVLNPCYDILNSDLKPFLVIAKKKGKVRIDKSKYSMIHDYFKENSVHFYNDVMYYYVVAKDENEAIEKGKVMKANNIDKCWLNTTN